MNEVDVVSLLKKTVIPLHASAVRDFFSVNTIPKSPDTRQATYHVRLLCELPLVNEKQVQQQAAV